MDQVGDIGPATLQLPRLTSDRIAILLTEEYNTPMKLHPKFLPILLILAKMGIITLEAEADEEGLKKAT